MGSDEDNWKKATAILEINNHQNTVKVIQLSYILNVVNNGLNMNSFVKSLVSFHYFASKLKIFP